MKYCNVMAIPQLLYGSDTWIRKAKDISRIQGAEMWFSIAVKGCTRRDLIRNDYTRMELGIADSLNEKISRYKMEWQLHVERMDPTRFSRTTLDYHPRGKRSMGRPSK